MPEINVYYFKDEKGNAPAYLWIKNLHQKVKVKAYARILRLEELGYEVLNNRTEAAFLRDEIYELRWQALNQHYRLLFTFNGRNVAILSHGIIKKTDSVPPNEIDKAINYRKLYLSDPDKYSMQSPD